MTIIKCFHAEFTPSTMQVQNGGWVLWSCSFASKTQFANPICGLFNLSIWLDICKLCPIINFLFRRQLSQEILLGLVEKPNQLYVFLALVKYDYAITNFNIQTFKRAYDVFVLNTNFLGNGWKSNMSLLNHLKLFKLYRHIHNYGTQKDCLLIKKLQRIILDLYSIYCLIIIVNCCMPITRMMSC